MDSGFPVNLDSREFSVKMGIGVDGSGSRSWWAWFVVSFWYLGDMLFTPINDFGRFPHLAFPVSILASLSAGIGEEIAFRGFVFGLWALILNWVFKRFNGRRVALWIANLIAALAFGAGHLGSAMMLTGAASIADLSPILLLEVFY